MLLKLTARRLWLASCLLILSSIALAQQKTVTGRITDAGNQPVAGASVIVKGTTIGTTTNDQGRFTISVPNNRNTLTVSYVGFDAQDVAISGVTDVNVALVNSNLTNLNEVVVTGYTSQNRKAITGAVSSIKGTQLQAVQSGNIEQQFQGRAPGVVVITSGQPGTGSQVRIRGFSSFTDNSPLYVVDGVPVFTTEHLAANDIESTTILKDAASASIYGASASAGVILVTTKKGRTNNKVNVTYDMSYGRTVPGKGLDLLTPQQLADWTWTALKATPGSVDATTGNPNHDQYGKGANPVLPDYLTVGAQSGLSGLAANDPRLDPVKFNTNFDIGPIY